MSDNFPKRVESYFLDKRFRRYDIDKSEWSLKKLTAASFRTWSKTKIITGFTKFGDTN